MRYTDLIGNQDDYIERQSIKPAYYPCPQCGQRGKRNHSITREVRHVAALHRRSWIVAEVGVYEATCDCCKYFQAPIAGVPYRGRYSYEVRNTVANALIRDRMPYGLVINRMREEHDLSLSLARIIHQPEKSTREGDFMVQMHHNTTVFQAEMLLKPSRRSS